MEKILKDDDDTSQRSRGEAAEMEDVLEQWLGCVNCPLLVHDAQGRILFANAAAGTLFGYPAPVLCDMQVADIEDTESDHFEQARARGLAAGTALARKTQLPLDVSLQRIAWRGEEAFLYTAHSRAEKEFLQEKTHRYARDLSLFQLFLMGVMDTPESDVHVFIARSLKDFADAFFVSISDYDGEARRLQHRHIEIESRLVGKLFHLLGTSLDNLHTPLSDADRERVLHTGWTIEKSLYEAAFHSIPQPVADALQRWFRIDRFIGIAYFHGNELLGTSLLAMQAHVPDPSIEMLQAFRYAISQFLHGHRMRRRLAELSRSHDFSVAMEVRGRIACSLAPGLQSMLDRILQECETAGGQENPAGALERIRPLAQEISSILKQFSDFNP